MAEQSWWQRVIAGVTHEYERRIRAASLVTEYGADHHGHDHAHEEEEEGEAAEIVNVPRGTRLGRQATPEPADVDNAPREG